MQSARNGSRGSEALALVLGLAEDDKARLFNAHGPDSQTQLGGELGEERKAVGGALDSPGA